MRYYLYYTKYTTLLLAILQKFNHILFCHCRKMNHLVCGRANGKIKRSMLDEKAAFNIVSICADMSLFKLIKKQLRNFMKCLQYFTVIK